MSKLILEMFNRIGVVKAKYKTESGYSFDNNGEDNEGVTVKYCDGARDVWYVVNEKVHRERRNLRRKELYTGLKTNNQDEFERCKEARRTKYKNQKGDVNEI